jgi:hypothetical protein
MKKTICLLALLSFLPACSGNKDVQFCEGVKPDGKGVNCGHKFESGELTVLVNGRDPFGTKTITLRVYETRGGKSEKIDTVTVDVKPDRQTASANLSLYNGGKYVVKASKNNVTIGEGNIEIVEQ